MEAGSAVRRVGDPHYRADREVDRRDFPPSPLRRTAPRRATGCAPAGEGPSSLVTCYLGIPLLKRLPGHSVLASESEGAQAEGRRSRARPRAAWRSCAACAAAGMRTRRRDGGRPASPACPRPGPPRRPCSGRPSTTTSRNRADRPVCSGGWPLWLYVLPPGLLTWLTTRPVIESKRLPELLESQIRYLAEPRVWCRLAPLRSFPHVRIHRDIPPAQGHGGAGSCLPRRGAP